MKGVPLESMKNREGRNKLTYLWKVRSDSICFSLCCWRAVAGGSWDFGVFDDPNIQLIVLKLREIDREVCTAKAYGAAFSSAILN